jgi:hypothetical protein
MPLLGSKSVLRGLVVLFLFIHLMDVFPSV